MVRTVDADELERHVIVLVDDNLARRPHVDRHFPAAGLIGLVQNIAGTGRQRIGRERLLVDRHTAFHLHGRNRKGTFFGLRLSGRDRYCREAKQCGGNGRRHDFLRHWFFLLALLLAPKKKSIREPAVRPPHRPRRQVTAARDKHGYFFRHKLGSERRQLFGAGLPPTGTRYRHSGPRNSRLLLSLGETRPSSPRMAPATQCADNQSRVSRDRRAAESGYEFPSSNVDCHLTLQLGVTSRAINGTIPRLNPKARSASRSEDGQIPRQ